MVIMMARWIRGDDPKQRIPWRTEQHV